MAFTATYLPVSRRTYFTFFNKNTLNGAFGHGFGGGFVIQSYYMDESFTFSHGAFEITEMRLHLVSAHISTVDFVIQLSSGSDSHYNVTFWSQPMLGVKDFRWRPDVENGLLFLSNDALLFSMAMSFANLYGLTIHGWSVIDHAMGE